MNEKSASRAVKAGGKSQYRWVMLALVMLVYIIVLGFTNQSFNILLASIVGDEGWTPVQKTAVSGAMSLGMVWFCFVAGSAIDKISVKKIMGTCLILLSVLIFLRGQATGFVIWYAMMFLYGVVSAFYQPCVTKTVSLWFDSEELATANGCTTAASPIGQITANLFAGRIAANLSGGWRQLFMIAGIIVFVLMVCWWIFAKNRTSMDAALTSTTIKEGENSLWKNIIGVLKDPYVWCMIIADAFFLGLIYAGGTYGNYVLQMDPNWAIDKTISGYAGMCNNFCSTVAYILLPIIIRKIGNKYYKWVVLITGFIAPIFFIIGYRSYNFTLLCICLGVAGIFYGGIVPGTKTLMLQRPSVSGIRAGTAFGLMMTVERLGVTVAVHILGGIIFNSADTMGLTMSSFYALQLIAPVFVLIALLYDRAQKKKAAQNA